MTGWRARVCGAALALLAGVAAAQQRVAVPGVDRAGGAPIELPGHWFAPPGPGPAPAMLLLHGCGGPYDARGALASHSVEMAARLARLGVGTLVLDSFTPRGERELCTQRLGTRRVTQAHRRADAQAGLRWLAAQPGVDAQRLGLMGWSNGGSTVLAATNLRHDDVAAGVKPSLAVAWYPGCAEERQRGHAPSAPLLMLLGAADDWTPAEPCVLLAKEAAPPQPEVEVYAGAYHGFDGTAPVRLRTDVPNGVRPGEGVHVGADPAARAAARQRLDSFLRARWGLTTAP